MVEPCGGCFKDEDDAMVEPMHAAMQCDVCVSLSLMKFVVRRASTTADFLLIEKCQWILYSYSVMKNL